MKSTTLPAAQPFFNGNTNDLQNLCNWFIILAAFSLINANHNLEAEKLAEAAGFQPQDHVNYRVQAMFNIVLFAVFSVVIAMALFRDTSNVVGSTSEVAPALTAEADRGGNGEGGGGGGGGGGRDGGGDGGGDAHGGTAIGSEDREGGLEMARGANQQGGSEAGLDGDGVAGGRVAAGYRLKPLRPGGSPPPSGPAATIFESALPTTAAAAGNAPEDEIFRPASGESGDGLAGAVGVSRSFSEDPDRRAAAHAPRQTATGGAAAEVSRPTPLRRVAVPPDGSSPGQAHTRERTIAMNAHQAWGWKREGVS